MKKSIKFEGIARINRDGRIRVDDGSIEHTIETPITKKDLNFIEGKLVQIKIINLEG